MNLSFVQVTSCLLLDWKLHLPFVACDVQLVASVDFFKVASFLVFSCTLSICEVSRRFICISDLQFMLSLPRSMDRALLLNYLCVLVFLPTRQAIRCILTSFEHFIGYVYLLGSNQISSAVGRADSKSFEEFPFLSNTCSLKCQGLLLT